MNTRSVADIFHRVIGSTAPVRITAYDGSVAGPPDAAVALRLRSSRALAYLARAPGSLGLARAYITGDLDVDGPLHTALSELADLTLHSIPRLAQLRFAGELFGARLKNRASIPKVEYRGNGRPHSKRRDAQVISHHYDVSNRFYSWILGPSMTYTCAVYPSTDASLEIAQHTKHQLIFRKLGLRPGMRLLDVGSGWGGMVMYAASLGVYALGVTLSREQAQWAQKEIVERGLTEFGEVRHLDYRDVPENGFDAVSSIGLTEHIGERQLPAYFARLYAKLRPGGRLLNHCITQPKSLSPKNVDRFIDRYVFPDGELHGIGHLITVMTGQNFEVWHEENLREHYVRTLADWSANLEAHWDEAVAEVGEQRARVWRLYMAGSQVGFERNNIQLHQVLGVRLDDRGRSSMPLRPDW
ncbi:MAG: class I SAM-dependent methyltransferase [Pseudonocardia sp.]|nr:class I SAM-dependent methyltransferase [Pseudonocardia sp.]